MGDLEQRRLLLERQLGARLERRAPDVAHERALVLGHREQDLDVELAAQVGGVDAGAQDGVERFDEGLAASGEGG